MNDPSTNNTIEEKAFEVEALDKEELEKISGGYTSARARSSGGAGGKSAPSGGANGAPALPKARGF